MLAKNIGGLILFVFLFFPGAADAQHLFEQHIITSSAGSVRDIYAVDLDGDFDVDVLSTSWLENTISRFENDGTGVFVEHVISSDALGAQSVFSIDHDDDGDTDVIAAGLQRIVIYENDGEEQFSEIRITSDLLKMLLIFPGDIDHDGDIDILSAAPGDDTIAWHENLGAGITSTEELEDKLTPPIAFNNFPNPFQSKTTIEFRVSEPGQVTLDVSDIQGRVFARLIDGYMNPGIHRVEFDGSGLAPGLYFTRLRRGEVQVVRKMVRVK